MPAAGESRRHRTKTARAGVVRGIMDDSNIWEMVLDRVATKVNQHTFYSWFKATSLEKDEGQRILVRVANPLVQKWLLRNYTAVLDEALAEVGRSGCGVEFVTEPVESDPAIDPGGAVGAEPLLAPVTSLSGLNPRYTFDTFVVGPSNQFADAACRAVAEAPSRSYNPLFIYGGVGLGKTHLMHAIGHYVLGHHPKLHLTYISSERFMNEMINAVKIRPDLRVPRALPDGGRPAGRRHPVPGRQGRHADGVLPHVQRAVRRAEADRASAATGRRARSRRSRSACGRGSSGA